MIRYAALRYAIIDGYGHAFAMPCRYADMLMATLRHYYAALMPLRRLFF